LEAPFVHKNVKESCKIAKEIKKNGRGLEGSSPSLLPCVENFQYAGVDGHQRGKCFSAGEIL